MYKNSEDYTDEIISRFPHMYRRDRESNNYFLLNLYLEEIRQASKGIYELLKSLNIMKAEGYALDKFGISFNLKRNMNENDENYRKRILAEISRKSKNATFETILNVLKIIIENYEQNIFIFKEGIIKDKVKNIDFKVKNGSFNGNFETQFYKEKAGSIYIILNKRLSAYIKKSILNILLEIRAKGVEITVDFKYKVQTANYISNGAFVGVKRILKIEDSFYDEILQQKSYESNLARINVITQEGVR
ncbi:hypothetical protein [Leptotrichia sp. oral taxon 847]|uniref:hypothetical protein n=1 Tax=Leptotrichia sp. oral taxon 847 TaxID=1785996 RepID=UPI0007683639|nr:hypothetical protein [Leptotrichia sp. oral taxon 847]AMD95674.1 hypothetical protein AXF11_08840 [Leptotrichia sp. oral taxon 847]